MKYLKKLRNVMVALSLVTPLITNAANVTIQVLKSDGSPLAGVAHAYYATYGYNMGNTNASGLLNYTVADGTYDFKVTYKGTSKTITAAVAGTQTLTFYTTAVNATVASCTATPISGVQLTSFTGTNGFHFPSHTNASGQASEQLFPGTYTITAKHQGTEETKSVTVTGNGLTAGATTAVTYTPTTLTLGNTGSKTYKAGSYSYFANGTVYLFPGTYEFTFASGHKTNLAIAGCAQNMTVNILVLKDHNNSPLAGGTARGGSGSNFSTFHVSGSTNAEGVLFDVRNNAGTTMSYEMTYNKTTSVLTQTSNNVYNYKTIQLKLKLETCDGAPLTGGSARYGHGSVATSFYYPGANSTNASGESVAEFFPGTYSFEMNTNSSSQVKSSVVVPNANTTLVWQTTAVTLNWPHTISYGGAGDSRFFNGPTMQLLPCTLNFNFRSPGANNYTALTISGCSMTLTPRIVRLISSTNAPLSGGEVSGYQGGWSTYGTTPANGNLLVLDANPSSLKIKYAGASQQVDVNMSVTPIVTFQTKAVTMELKDANGNHLEGTGLSYYADTWRTFGSGSTTGGVATMELLPVSYSFNLGYAGATQQKSNHNVNVNQLVSYQTKTVTMELRDSEGALLDGATGLMYYANGWNTFGTGATTGGVATMQLLPVTYSFRLGYEGGNQQISNQNVDANQVVSYQTRLVTMELVDSDGNHMDGGTGLSYYAGGWRTFGSGATLGGIATMELLPLTYSFNLGYAGATQQKSNHDVSVNQTVSYQTTAVTMELRNSEGALIEGGTGLSYHANGWNTFGSGSAEGGVASMQLLPVSYSFKLSYKGAAQQISNQNVSVNPLVSYQTAPVSVSLKDQNGTPMQGGAASFYAGTWQSMGTTDVNGIVSTELLPASYVFKMVYNAKSNLQSNIVAPADVIFFYNTSTNLFRYGNTEDEPGAVAANSASSMELYPNPVSGKLNIKFYSESEKSATVKILDMTGKVVISESFVATEGANTHLIDLSHLSTGAYFVMFNNVDVEAKRIVVQH